MKIINNRRTKESGITLIALIITIIVLLILAGITIGMLTSNNSVLKQSRLSKEKTIIAEEEEAIDISCMGVMTTNKEDNYIKAQELENELERNGHDVTVTENEEEEKLIITFNDTEHVYTRDNKKNIYQASNPSTPTPTPTATPTPSPTEPPIVYVMQITRSGVTTKYETVASAVAALEDGDLLETIGKLQYDQIIDIRKAVTVSGEIEFTNSGAYMQVSGKTLTLKDLIITGISSIPVATSGSNKSSNSKIYVGENSNVSITGVNIAVANNYGEIEINSGTYSANSAAVYCGGSQSGGHFVTTISGSNTNLIGRDYILSANSSANLTVGSEVNKTLSGSYDIYYQGGGAVFNIPESYTILNATHGSYTLNGVFHAAGT